MTDRSYADSAVISLCGLYRYELQREVNPFGDGNCLFLMLNPSTADAMQDDPTIRRCKAFAEAWGHKRLIVANLFSFRATDPRAMKEAADPIGPDGDEAIMDAVYCSGTVVCAWGAHGGHLDRDRQVIAMIRKVMPDVYCLNTTKNGFPCHPLYQPKDAVLKPYRGRP